MSSCYLTLFTSIGADVRFDEGALRALHVVAPEGSVVNAREPAPVSGCTIASAQAIVEAVWIALAQATPRSVDAGWSRWCAPATMGFNPRTGRPFGDINFMCKGGGGYGSPLQRPIVQVLRDVVDGLVSPAAAQSKYGVVIDPVDLRVDEARTAALRKKGSERR